MADYPVSLPVSGTVRNAAGATTTFSTSITLIGKIFINYRREDDTMGVPGTGLFWTERIPPAAPPSAAHRVNFGVAALIVIVVLFALAR